MDGKANARLIQFLARAFAVPKQRVRLERGTQGRSKVILIDAPVVLPAPLAESSNRSRDSV